MNGNKNKLFLLSQKYKADIEKWQAELGDKALLDNINTFPINMVGVDDDLMLRATPQNCPRYGQALKENEDILNKSIFNITQYLYPKLE
jgi:hypothetical protein